MELIQYFGQATKLCIRARVLHQINGVMSGVVDISPVSVSSPIRLENKTGLQSNRWGDSRQIVMIRVMHKLCHVDDLTLGAVIPLMMSQQKEVNHASVKMNQVKNRARIANQVAKKYQRNGS